MSEWFPAIVLVLLILAAPAALSQEERESLDEKELRRRLEVLDSELDEERKALEEAEKSFAETEKLLKARRRTLARRLLDAKAEANTLAGREDASRKRVIALEKETLDLREAARRIMTSCVGLAEYLDIHLQEIPSDKRDILRIREVLQDLPDEPELLEPDSFLRNLKILTAALDRAHRESCRIESGTMKLRTADGLVEEVKRLAVGHAAFAYETTEGGRVGLALASPTDASGYRWTEEIDETTARTIRDAVAGAESGGARRIAVPLDVSGRLRVDARLRDEGLAAKLHAGGPVMYPLGAVALLALLVIGERAFWLFLRNSGRSAPARRILEACRMKRHEEAEKLAAGLEGVVPRTLAACLRRRGRGVSAMEDAIQEQLLHELPRLRRYMSGLAIMAAVAPLMGLLGTVTGIIDTFGVMRTVGNTNPGLMAGGISEALITTATGLIIAIPIILCRGALLGRMDRILGDAERHAATLVTMLAKEH